MYIDLIVDGGSGSPDRLFTYLHSGKESLEVGDRVIVPFGKGNKATPALVYKIISENPNYKCKEIITILDRKYSFSKSQLFLIYLLRLNYGAKYNQAYRLILPAQENLIIYTRYKVIQNQLFQLNCGEFLNEKEMKKLAGKKEVEALISSRKLEKIHEYELKIREMKLEIINPLFDDLNKELEKLSKNAIKQARILKYAYSNRKVEYSKLISACSCTRKDVMNLVNKSLLSISFDKKEVDLSKYFNKCEKSEKVKMNLSKEQDIAYKKYLNHKAKASDIPFRAIINGVTGSGKTKLYFEIVKEVLKSGKQALFLLPEIALTPQLLSQVYKELSQDVAVIHTHVSGRDKARYYADIRSGKINVVVGARSALFAPFKELGIIVIDESHEKTYKSEQNPRYDALTLAMELSKLNFCDIILGSATTNLSTFYQAKKNEYYDIRLTKRIGGVELPEIFVIDMKSTERVKSSAQSSQISEILYEKLKGVFENNEQAMILHNRKGYASYRECQSCSHIEKCINCDVSLSVSNRSGDLVCRYCDYKIPGYSVCSSCGEKVVDRILALKSVEEELCELFPNRRFVSVDSDSTRSSEKYMQILSDFAEHKIDAILGTQVIAKGFDFDDVTLAAVINADKIFHSPDFEASEKAFALMYQLAGRAGRRKKRGEVYIQSTDCNHRVLTHLINNDYFAFLNEENELRKMSKFPPYSDFISIRVVSEFDNMARAEAEKINNLLKDFAKKNELKITVYPAREQYYLRIKNKYNYNVLIKNYGENYHSLVRLLYNALVIDKYKLLNKKVSLSIDFSASVL